MLFFLFYSYFNKFINFKKKFMRNLIVKNWKNRIYIKEILVRTQEEIDANPRTFKDEKAGDKRVVDRSGFIEIIDNKLKIVKATAEDKKIYQELIKKDAFKTFNCNDKKEFVINNISLILNY